MEFREEFRAYFPVAWICILTDPLLLLWIFFLLETSVVQFFFYFLTVHLVTNSC